SSLSFFFSSTADHVALHSFPTRRSSDLEDSERGPIHHRREDRGPPAVGPPAVGPPAVAAAGVAVHRHLRAVRVSPGHPNSTKVRSEEHTSELQSQSNLVCRLLLEKKQKT